MASFAVVALDMSRNSMQGHRASPERQEVVARARPFFQWARSQGIPVLFSNGLRRPTDAWFWKAGWETHCVPGDDGALTWPELIEPGDIEFVKRRYSNFYETEMDVTLRELGADSLILTGWSTSVALLTTAIDAWQRFYGVIVPADLTCAHTWGGKTAAEQKEWALAYIEAFAVGTITTSDAIMAGEVLPGFEPGLRRTPQD
jgi:nicotinamidase-related amidase